MPDDIHLHVSNDATMLLKVQRERQGGYGWTPMNYARNTGAFGPVVGQGCDENNGEGRDGYVKMVDAGVHCFFILIPYPTNAAVLVRLN